MDGLIALNRLHHVNIVTNDVRRGMAEYAALFGVTKWSLRHLQSDRHGDVTLRGKKTSQRYESALGLNGDIGIEVKQPLEGDRTLLAGWARDRAQLEKQVDDPRRQLRLLHGGHPTSRPRRGRSSNPVSDTGLRQPLRCADFVPIRPRA